MRRMHVLMVATLLAGCQDHTPTSVAAPVGPRPAVAAEARMAIDDVVDRIVPALGNEVTGKPLAEALRSLAQALDAGRLADGSVLARDARTELERYAHLGGGDAAEVDAIRLALAVLTATD